MKYFNLLSRITKNTIILTLAFLLFGYLCRLAGIYFFWESKTIGWVLFWIALIFFLRDRIKQQRLLNRKAVLEKIGIGLCVFVIIIKCVLFFATKQTSAYESAINFIKTDPAIANKVGGVKSIFLEPYGGMSMTTNSQGSSGEADLNFIVKGAKKYIDLNLLLYKEFETDWKIEIAE